MAFVPSQPTPAQPTPESATTAAEPMPWAQQTVSVNERTTSRLRRLVHGLPDWEPMPPGEILVNRHGQT
jgi:hypothetical protein